eukprot:gb/GECH01003039.1/.p1 GENE.gb/GECH01003039.1/~~gb/GECH01003039.1/.p1  ORF type:complete len:828 (+),score=141.89 gb/GECH01003039.1/:1-2484(+)
MLKAIFPILGQALKIPNSDSKNETQRNVKNTSCVKYAMPVDLFLRKTPDTILQEYDEEIPSNEDIFIRMTRSIFLKIRETPLSSSKYSKKRTLSWGSSVRDIHGEVSDGFETIRKVQFYQNNTLCKTVTICFNRDRKIHHRQITYKLAQSQEEQVEDDEENQEYQTIWEWWSTYESEKNEKTPIFSIKIHPNGQAVINVPWLTTPLMGWKCIGNLNPFLPRSRFITNPNSTETNETNTTWRVLYTQHSGIDPQFTTNIHDLFEVEGHHLTQVMLTSFRPFEPEFISSLMSTEVPLTFIHTYRSTTDGQEISENCLPFDEEHKHVQWCRKHKNFPGVIYHPQCFFCRKEITSKYGLKCKQCNEFFCDSSCSNECPRNEEIQLNIKQEQEKENQDTQFELNKSLGSYCQDETNKCNHEDLREVNIWMDSCDCPEHSPNLQNVHLISPYLHDQFLFHAKLFLLQFDTFLRCVISSFNSSQEQREKAGDSFWIFDAPLLKETENHNDKFRDDLIDFLSHINHVEEWIDIIKMYDFSSVGENVQLVWSIPKNTDTGYPMLEECTADIPMGSRLSPTDIQVWSFGGAKHRWYEWFLYKISPKMDYCRFILSNGTHSNKNIEAIMKLCYIDEECPLAPQKKDIKWGWHSKTMTRQYLCSECNQTHGWIYTGSHNLSMACWGHPIHGPRNWELGLIIKKSQCDSNFDLGSVPLPFKRSSLAPYLGKRRTVTYSIGERKYLAWGFVIRKNWDLYRIKIPGIIGDSVWAGHQWMDTEYSKIEEFYQHFTVSISDSFLEKWGFGSILPLPIGSGILLDLYPLLRWQIYKIYKVIAPCS